MFNGSDWADFTSPPNHFGQKIAVFHQTDLSYLHIWSHEMVTIPIELQENQEVLQREKETECKQSKTSFHY